MTFLADISYSVYLFHWPLYVIFSHRMSNWVAAILTTGVSIGLSALSYYVLDPVIAGKPVHIFQCNVNWKKLWLPTMVAIVLLGVNGESVVKAAPPVSTLEQNLWISGIRQDVNLIQSTHTAILANTGPVTTAGEKTKVHVPTGVSIIGDSVTLGTRDYLGQHVANSTIDAEGDRTMNLADQVLIAQQRNHRLRQDVVICIGTNALDGYRVQIMKLIDALAPGHRLIFMTPYNAQTQSDWNSSKLAVFEWTLPAKYKYVTIADWEKVAGQHPAVFAGTDGVHFGGVHAGDVLYAQVINQALKVARTKPCK